MTHIQNYGNDRLALYTFESLFNFIKCWTNLKLKQISPYEAGKKYFEIFPEDKEPLWLVGVGHHYKYLKGIYLTSNSKLSHIYKTLRIFNNIVDTFDA